MSYASSRTNAYLHLIRVVADAGHDMYYAVNFAAHYDAKLDDQIFILAMRSPESIVRAFRQWHEPVKLNEEAEALRIIAALRGVQ